MHTKALLTVAFPTSILNVNCLQTLFLKFGMLNGKVVVQGNFYFYLFSSFQIHLQVGPNLVVLLWDLRISIVIFFLHAWGLPNQHQLSSLSSSPALTHSISCFILPFSSFFFLSIIIIIISIRQALDAPCPFVFSCLFQALVTFLEIYSQICSGLCTMVSSTIEKSQATSTVYVCGFYRFYVVIG